MSFSEIHFGKGERKKKLEKMRNKNCGSEQTIGERKREKESE